MHKRQILLIIIYQFVSLLNINAQGVLCSWLSDPMAKYGQQTLFLRTYVHNDGITKACIEIASKGEFRLFVNGRAVFTSYVYGDNLNADDDCEAYSFDVTDYMRNDSNTIAVWYAPDIINSNYNVSENKPMVAVCFYGTMNGGMSFSHFSDSSWLCTNANATSNINAEDENSLEDINEWNIGDPATQMIWRRSQEVRTSWTKFNKSFKRTSFSDYNVNIISPNYFDVSDDKSTISYDFDKGFWGTVRISLRGAIPGEKIYFNGSEYTCNGKLDEQYIGRFVHYGMRKLHVTGDKYFQISHIIKVEGLELVKNGSVG